MITIVIKCYESLSIHGVLNILCLALATSRGGEQRRPLIARRTLGNSPARVRATSSLTPGTSHRTASQHHVIGKSEYN